MGKLTTSVRRRRRARSGVLTVHWAVLSGGFARCGCFVVLPGVLAIHA